MEFWQVVSKRRSTRKFQDKEIQEEDLQKILTAANRAPSAHNFQSYKILVVKEKKVKEELLKGDAVHQTFIPQAAVVLIFCADSSQLLSYHDREMADIFSLQDATIACTFAWLRAVDLGLSACWIGSFNWRKACQILGLPRALRPVAILPVGFAAETPPPTPRKRIEEVIKII